LPSVLDFKMEKVIIDRRVEQMRAEGVFFRTSVDVGVDVTADQLRRDFDAVVLAGGARTPRDLPIPGRELGGIEFAMPFLTQQNKRNAGDVVAQEGELLATGKRVVVIGGGDTGSDCVGTSVRQGATSVAQLELMPKPSLVRMPTNPWPEWPLVLRSSSSHEEGCARDWAVMTKSFRGENGQLTALEAVRFERDGAGFKEIPGTSFLIPCELALLAMGFTGPEQGNLFSDLGVSLDGRGNVATDAGGQTNVAGVFAAGDVNRGQSLVVWAIADGRRVAATVNGFLQERSATAA